MKYGLLITSPVSTCKNIGDYVQSLAARQYLIDDYCYVEKEEISKFNSEESIKVIMNAWYMWHPENWPPKPCIKPLLISMHITSLTAKEMMTNEGREYLIEHGPVGCRDLDTKKILDEEGVPCYFSGCLTLTLGKTYKFEGEREGIYFVDPYIPALRYVVDGKSFFFPKNALKALWYYLKNFRKINKLVREKNYFKARYACLTYYNASMFYKAYSSLFDDDVLFKGEYLTHMVSVNETDTNDVLMEKAERLVKKYARSKLVVTSRIHCGLPCLGLETPVLFVLDKAMESKKNMFNAPGRFGGLLEFFNVVKYNNDKLELEVDNIKYKGKIDGNTQIVNKEKWKQYRDSLYEECKEFTKEI